VDRKISRRKLARQVLLHERRKYSAEVKGVDNDVTNMLGK
jgi:hypothetical protein